MTPTLRRNFSSPMLSLNTCFVHLGQLNRRCSAVSSPSWQLGQIGESSIFISHLVFASTRLLPILSCSMRLRYQFNVDEGLSAARWCTSLIHSFVQWRWIVLSAAPWGTMADRWCSRVDSLAISSTFSFPSRPACPGTQTMITCFPLSSIRCLGRHTLTTVSVLPSGPFSRCFTALWESVKMVQVLASSSCTARSALFRATSFAWNEDVRFPAGRRILLTPCRSEFRFLRLPYRCWLIRPSRSVVPFEAAL